MSALRGFLRGDDLSDLQRDGGVEVRLIGVIVFVGTLASGAYHGAIAAFTDRRWPSTTFLFRPEDRFGDFLEVYGNVLRYGRGGDSNIVYSGFLHMVTRGLAVLPELPAWLAVTVLFACVLVMTLWYGVTARLGPRGLRDAYVLVFCILSYPVLFLVDRANLEMLIFVLLAAFVYLYYVRRSGWAWLPLALAIAGKYYWVVLLVLPLSDRRWRQFALAVAGSVIVTIVSAVSLAAISGLGFAEVLKDTVATLRGHAGQSGLEWGFQHGHTLHGLVLFIDRATGYALQMMVHIPPLYLVAALGVFALVFLRLLLYDLEAWRKLTALIVCALLLPLESHDYTLVHLYLPLALVGAWGMRSSRGRLYAVVFGLLLVPLDYVRFGITASWSTALYPVLLALLLVAVLTDGATRRRSWIRADAEEGVGA
jgi:hypothetical protein